MKKIVQAAALFALVSFSMKDDIIGRWQTKPSERGNVTGVVFKADKSFEGYVNRKPFTTGKYEFADSILSFTDNGCGGAKGIYKIAFFSNGDSLRFVPMEDTCTARRIGMSKLIMGRVK